VSKIRSERNPELDCEGWKTKLPPGIDVRHNSILLESMAYGDDPNDVKVVLQAKINKLNSNSDTNKNEDPTITSLKNIIEPLRKLKDKKSYPSSFNLFHAVLEIDNDKIAVSF
jgi:hypothetical protein